MAAERAERAAQEADKEEEEEDEKEEDPALDSLSPTRSQAILAPRAQMPVPATVGALIMAPQMLQTVKNLLTQMGVFGVKCTPYSAGSAPEAPCTLLALHVSGPNIVAALAAPALSTSALPAEVRALLSGDGAVTFVPGIHVGSAACRRVTMQNKRKAAEQGSKDAALGRRPHSCTAGGTTTTAAFTFIELFAGIGGFRIGLEVCASCSIGGVDTMCTSLLPSLEMPN